MNEQPDAEAIAAEIRKKPEFKEMVAQAHALVQPDAGPKGIDLDDVDRAYDKWAEHRNGQSRLDAFRAGAEFGLRHTALAQSDASAGLIEAAEIAEQVMAEDKASLNCEAGLRTMAILTAKDIAARIRARAADRSGK